MTPEKRAKRPYKIDPEIARERARKGGLARAAKLSEAEQSEVMKKVRAARTAKAEAAGHTPKRRAGEPALSTEVLLFWKDVVRAEQPDREWKHPMELTRAAMKRARSAGVFRCTTESAGHQCELDHGHAGTHRASLEWP